MSFLISFPEVPLQRDCSAFPVDRAAEFGASCIELLALIDFVLSITVDDRYFPLPLFFHHRCSKFQKSVEAGGIHGARVGIFTQ